MAGNHRSRLPSMTRSMLSCQVLPHSALVALSHQMQILQDRRKILKIFWSRAPSLTALVRGSSPTLRNARSQQDTLPPLPPQTIFGSPLSSLSHGWTSVSTILPCQQKFCHSSTQPNERRGSKQCLQVGALLGCVVVFQSQSRYYQHVNIFSCIASLQLGPNSCTRIVQNFTPWYCPLPKFPRCTSEVLPASRINVATPRPLALR